MMGDAPVYLQQIKILPTSTILMNQRIHGFVEFTRMETIS